MMQLLRSESIHETYVSSGDVYFAACLPVQFRAGAVAMSHVFPRNSKTPPPMVSHGEGPFLVGENGESYLNCGDAAVSCLGHSDAHVTNAIKAQLDHVAFAHGQFQYPSC